MAASQESRSVARRYYLREAGELLLVGLGFLLYFIVRANVVDNAEVALAHARSLVDLERDLGIYVEPEIQRWVLQSDLLVRLFNLDYFWLDFPLIAAVGLALYAWRRPQYTFTRDAILFSGLVALVCYNLWPLAPPRLLPESGLIDTLEQFNNLSYQAQSTEFFVNPYAAMPSLHVGWAFLLAIGVWRAFPGNRLALVLAMLHPVSQWSSTIATGNHFILDGVGGLGVSILGLAFALAMERRGYAQLRRWLPAGR